MQLMLPSGPALPPGQGTEFIAWADPLWEVRLQLRGPRLLILTYSCSN